VTGNGSAEVFLKKGEPVKDISGKGHLLPPWLFQHEGLISALENANTVDQETITNMLNYLHFMDEFILAYLRHAKYEESIFMPVYPEPCLGRELVCRWSSENLPFLDWEQYQFLYLVIDDGWSMILVPATLKGVDDNRISFELPQTSYAVGQRQAKRYACRDVEAVLIQGGFKARGELLDFSPFGFRVKVSPDSQSSFHWFNQEAPVIIHILNNQQIVFSGACRCIRQGGELQEREIVLVFLDESVTRFKKKQNRNPRQHLVPSPKLIFDHPFLNKRVELEVSDISTSGFSVNENSDEGVLIAGMIIPELKVDFAGALMMKCRAQVIYRLRLEEKVIRCGLSILDMDVNTYTRLTHLVTNAMDPHAYISSEVDMDALWEFFFDTGFIYPVKYRLIQSHRENFKETYRKLYQESPEIARHFTYQKNGRIYGHISMIRAYERSWMIHHHAARAMGSRRSGFMVLKQIMHYLNDMYRLPSAKMDYVMCYFRPENRFPNIVFGGFARALANPRGCSMDLFAYLPYTTLSLGAQLPHGWSLKECSELDLWELNRFYNYHSGGLLIDALSLRPKGLGEKSLEKAYSQLGFLRKWRAYSLRFKEKLNAVLIVNQSDLGLNLSELINGIKILATDPEALPWNTLSIAISQLAGMYNTNRVPVLFYPFDYVKAKSVPYEKKYQLWVLNVQYGNEYMEYMQQKFKISYKNT